MPDLSTGSARVEILLPQDRVLYVAVEDNDGTPMVVLRDAGGYLVHSVSLRIFPRRYRA